MGPKRSFTIEFKIEAVKYAWDHSTEAAARKYQVDPKRIRDWRKQYPTFVEMIEGNAPKRKRLAGAGRRSISTQMEKNLLAWIFSRRDQQLRVSQKMIQVQALQEYQEWNLSMGEQASGGFVASRGWLENFLKRHELTLRQKPTASQKDPGLLVDHLVGLVLFVRKCRLDEKYPFSRMIAMDETACVLYGPDREMLRFTVCLAAKADGKKLMPFVVFREGVWEMKSLQESARGAVVSETVNGWLNDEVTTTWINIVLGKFAYGRRLLLWDSYHCHVSRSTKRELEKCQVDAAVIPGGCAKYIHAPSVCWKSSFKSKMRSFYEDWLIIREKQLQGSPRSAFCILVMEWVVKAWDALPQALIVKSFKSCGVTVTVDGREDGEIHCFQVGQPCEAGREVLRIQNEAFQNAIAAGQVPTFHAGFVEEDEGELGENELVVVDDLEDSVPEACDAPKKS